MEYVDKAEMIGFAMRHPNGAQTFVLQLDPARAHAAEFLTTKLVVFGPDSAAPVQGVSSVEESARRQHRLDYRRRTHTNPTGETP